MELDTVTLDARPDLAAKLMPLPQTWPMFLTGDRIAARYFSEVATHFKELCVVAVSPRDELIARVRTVAFDSEVPGRHVDHGYAGGWGDALLWALSDQAQGRRPNTACVLEVDISPTHRTDEVRGRVLGATLEAARRAGCASVAYPLRPLGKHLQPDLSMAEYAAATGSDGLPVDPILRFHASMGATPLGVAPASLVVVDSLTQWEEWTDLSFEESGPTLVPEALNPVWCDLVGGCALYAEPSVWMQYEVS